MAIGASGDKRHIDILVNTLRQNIGQRLFRTESELYGILYEILLELHRIYNVERSRRLGYKDIRYFLNVSALIGVKLLEGPFCICHISADLWPSFIDNYKSIGSGAALANLLLVQQNRAPQIMGQKLSDRLLDLNTWTAIYVINEVKTLDTYTGGNTRVVTINQNGYMELPDDEQIKIYKDNDLKVSEYLANSLFNDSNLRATFKQIFTKMYPKSDQVGLC
jgi:hypothetical protein